MPAVNIIISELDRSKLQQDYEKMCTVWNQQGRQALPPPFEHWLGQRLMANVAISAEEINHIRLFAAIEKLVTSLHFHGFSLIHVAGQQKSPNESSLALAQALANHFSLSEQYVRRLQDVFNYYLKNVDTPEAEKAEGPSLHTSTAIEQAYQEFFERTMKALDHLGTERAIGRVEGAIAILVSLLVMPRETARKVTQAFKLQVRRARKND